MKRHAGRSLRNRMEVRRMDVRVCAVYRCRHCGAVYKVGEYDAENLAVTACAVGLYQGERVLPDYIRAAMLDIHTCDGCVPKYGIADLVGWEP